MLAGSPTGSLSTISRSSGLGSRLLAPHLVTIVYLAGRPYGPDGRVLPSVTRFLRLNWQLLFGGWRRYKEQVAVEEGLDLTEKNVQLID